jgi:predicted transcriptional regulator
MDSRINNIAKRLKELRVEKGYSSYENFAWDNNIPRIQYWRMEKGTNFTIKNLLRILDAHQISLKDFFEKVDDYK